MISSMAMGFVLWIGITIPVGTQNAWVLSRGISRSHHVSTALICWLCDVVLIGLGIFGWGLLVGEQSAALTLLTLAGIAFLTIFGLVCLRNAWHGYTRREPAEGGLFSSTRAMGANAVLMMTLAVTLLNPHKYLDTLVIMSSLANDGFAEVRLSFYVGSIAGSLVWFALLAFCGHKAGPLLQTRPMRIAIDLIVAAMTLSVAAAMAGSYLMETGGAVSSPFGANGQGHFTSLK